MANTTGMTLEFAKVLINNQINSVATPTIVKEHMEMLLADIEAFENMAVNELIDSFKREEGK